MAWIEIVERGVQGKSFKEKLTVSGGAEQTHEDFFLVMGSGVYLEHICLRQLHSRILCRGTDRQDHCLTWLPLCGKSSSQSTH